MYPHRALVPVVAILLMLVTSSFASAQEGCALALGRASNGGLVTQATVMQPTEVVAARLAAQLLVNAQAQYIDARGMLNEAARSSCTRTWRAIAEA